MSAAGEAPLAPSDVVVRAPDPVAVEVDGSVVMMSLARGRYYGLDSVASRIWEIIAEPQSVEQICATIADEFEVTPEACLADVLSFLGDMRRERLIRILDAPA